MPSKQEGSFVGSHESIAISVALRRIQKNVQPQSKIAIIAQQSFYGKSY